MRPKKVAYNPNSTERFPVIKQAVTVSCGWARCIAFAMLLFNGAVFAQTIAVRALPSPVDFEFVEVGASREVAVEIEVIGVLPGSVEEYSFSSFGF